MVDVGVAQYHGVEVRRVRQPHAPVPQAQRLQPLKQPAVEEDAPLANRDEVHRSRHRARGAEELERGGHERERRHHRPQGGGVESSSARRAR